jgi:tetratricopeptide (TPR) repeat protein
MEDIREPSLRDALRASPAEAYRDFFRLQERLRDEGETARLRELAQELWDALPELAFASDEERARFHHNVAVFFGSPGGAADLSRARQCFGVALDWWREHDDSGWHARVLHNFATALSNLGSTEAELAEAVGLFERALAWRTAEREIARAVTLHHLGIAWRRLAEIAPERAPEALVKSAAALNEAVGIRRRHGLAEGEALSLFHLALSLERSGSEEAASRFDEAAAAFERLGMESQAEVSRQRGRAIG